MTTEVHISGTEPPAAGLSDCERMLASLRQQGAEHWSPVDFYYLETLARRLHDQAPNVRHILENRLATAVAAYQTRFEQAPRLAAPVPTQPPTALSQLVSALVPCAPEAEPGSWAAPSGGRTELKSVRNFRNTWSKLSAQKQVAKALGQAPKNAGPINSHMLVLRSLELMRDISPDYLNRFMSYADTLLCLDQPEMVAKPPARKAAGGRTKAPPRG